MSLLDDVLVQLRLRARFQRGRVTGTDPLMVLLDGDTTPIHANDTLCSVVTGDRVRVEASGLRRIVHARYGDGPRECVWSTGSTVASGAEVEITVTLPRVGVVSRVGTSHAARVRLYDRAAKSTADAGRASGVQPSGDHGVLLEVDGATAAEMCVFNPKPPIENLDGGTEYKLRVKNVGGSSAVISGSIWVVL